LSLKNKYAHVPADARAGHGLSPHGQRIFKYLVTNFSQGPKQMEATLLTSSGISIMTGVPRTSIIQYSDAGILNPQRDSAGRRLYTLDDVAKLNAYRDAKKAMKAEAA
jgi:MerR-like DNA binding protein